MSRSADDALRRLDDVLATLPPDEAREFVEELSRGTGQGQSAQDVKPDYETWYNQTDEHILELIKRHEPHLNRWRGLVSHLNTTTLLENEEDITEFIVMVRIAYWEGIAEHNDNAAIAGALNALRDFCELRAHDALHGHRANMLTSRTQKRIFELSGEKKRSRILGL